MKPTIPDIKIAIIGLGYVGLPLARLFATKYSVVGYDIDFVRVAELQKGYDHNSEISDEALQFVLLQGNPIHTNSVGLFCTTDIADIKDCNIYIVTVPTPVNQHNHPDLKPLLQASETVAKMISKNNIVIYESTVYPGVTEEECIPCIEAVSGLVFNQDFFAGYSPERINPGDKEHRVENIKKVTSGSTPEIAQKIDDLYNSVLQNGTHLAPSIRVAEASKIIENAQRDVNIAFINELAKIFNVIGIDTHDVIEAASSKWNFIKIQPGLVGGHCISVDPYYLIQKAQVYGYLPRIMSDARRLNDGMGDYVARQVIDLMNKKGILVKDAKILILGAAFKENCPDIRNTKVVDVYNTLDEYDTHITIYDPWVDNILMQKEYNLEVKTSDEETLLNQFDVVILAVAHNEFKNKDIRSFLRNENGVVYDVKSALDKSLIDGRL